MSGDTMVARAKKLVDDGDVEYVNTNGNTLNFQGRGHNVSKDEVYLITAEIQLNGEIEWSCNCRHNEFHDDCKHTIACGSNNDSWSLLIKEERRLEYKAFSNEDDGRDDRHMQDDKVVVKIQIESDDD